MMKHLLLRLALVPVFFLSLRAHALPDFVKHGYFSCTSCHVSPGGGGVLTPYGRGFASEKLSTWAYEKEELPFHGALNTNESPVLVGGHFRQIQTHVSNSHIREGRYFPMQRMIEMAAIVKGLAVVGDIGVQDHQSKRALDETIYESRTHYAQLTVAEAFIIRAGRFFPKYGLMIPQHNAAIRSGLGFNQGQELYLGEAGYYGEAHELSFSGIFGSGGGKVAGDVDGDAYKYKRRRGFGATYSSFIFEKNRVGLNWLRDWSDKDARLLTGAFAALNFSDQVGMLLEVDGAHTQAASVKSKKLATYSKLYVSVLKGLTPAITIDSIGTSSKDQWKRQDTLSFLLQWYPRPHFEFELSIGAMLTRPEFAFSDVGYLMLHYYL